MSSGAWARVEWNQVKAEFRNTLQQFELGYPGNLRRDKAQFRSSSFSAVEVKNATVNAAWCTWVELPPR